MGANLEWVRLRPLECGPVVQPPRRHARCRDAVFTLGEKNSLANFDSVRRRIANHASTNLDSSMCDLMLHDMEQTFTKPTRPTSKAVTRSETDDDKGKGKVEQYDPFEMKEYDKEYDSYIRDKKEYGRFKGKCFILIMGQCSTALVNKLEGDKTGFQKLRKTNDVVGLLKQIKEYMSLPCGEEYLIDTMVQLLMKYLNISQTPNESFPDFQSRLETMCEATHAKPGSGASQTT